MLKIGICNFLYDGNSNGLPSHILLAQKMTPDKSEVKAVQASFVFVDSLRNPIPEIDVVLRSASFEHTGVTDAMGVALASCSVKRNEKISVFIKRRDGKLAHKFDVVPDRDINIFTMKSGEFHFAGTTKIAAEDALERVSLPEIKVGEIMTIDRLLGELSPYVGSTYQVEDIGKVIKDYPKKKKIPQVDPSSGKPSKPLIEIEHHYKIEKIEKPLVSVVNVLGSKLNYPKNTEASAELLKSIAEEFGCEIAALRAVAATESQEQSFMDNGMPKILFERHHFYKFTKPEKKKGAAPTPHPFAAFADICNPTAGGYGAESLQYAKLVRASRLHREAAIMSCSWGAFQVMGGFWREFGYKSVEQLANECMESVDGQIQLFRHFLKMKDRKPAIDALKAKNWETFTFYYNGSNWRKQNPSYPDKMAKFYDQFKI